MKKFSVLVLTVLFSCINSFAFTPENTKIVGKIEGKIIDASSAKVIEYATVVVLKDSTMISGTTTDTKGSFSIDKIPEGNYKVKVSFVGYNDEIVNPIQIGIGKTHIDLGTIKLRGKDILLGESIVTGEKQNIEFSNDKIIVNVDKAIVASGGSAIDVLRNTPSVSVDQDGNVSIRGNSNVNFLIDGKQSGLSSTKMLEQIPANAVDKIEVMTNPSAKHDAEGTAGIINIVMKKKMDNNFNGLVTASAGTKDNYNGALNFNYKKDQINYFFNYDNRFFNRSMVGDMERENLSLQGTTYNDQTVRQGFTSYSHNVKGGIDYTFNDKNSITTSLLYNNGKGDRKFNTYSNIFDAGRNFLNSSTNRNSMEATGSTYDYLLNYKRTFETQGKELITDLYVSKSVNDDFTNRYSEFFSPDNSKPAYMRQNITGTNDNLFGSLKSDFTLPFGEKGKLETGYKITLRDRDMDYLVDDYNIQSALWSRNNLLSNEFAYLENIQAAYGMYSDQFKKFKYQLGLRAEYTYTKSNQKTTDEQYKTDYASVFPTVHISQEFFTGQETRLSYSRRINRPFIGAVNPFVRYLDENTAFAGNPYLKPEYIDSYEFSNSLFINQSSAIATLFYRKLNDNITTIIEMLNNGVMLQTMANVANQETYGIELNGSHKIFQWWSLNVNYSYYKSKFNGQFTGSDYAKTQDVWTARFNSMMQLFWGLDLQFNGNYMSAFVIPQGRTKGVFFSDLALKKSFMEKKLTFSLRLNDVFNAMKFQNEIMGSNFSIRNSIKPASQTLSLSITYMINNFKRNQERRPEDNAGGREYESIGN